MQKARKEEQEKNWEEIDLRKRIKTTNGDRENEYWKVKKVDSETKKGRLERSKKGRE